MTPLVTSFENLTREEKEIVRLAFKGAEQSCNNGLCFKSDFPVGSGILGRRADGRKKKFSGANVENEVLSATICAERSAATASTKQGYKDFEIVSVLCQKHPGGSPCGLCRQVLVQFGRNGLLLNVMDLNGSVAKSYIRDLLPAAIAAQLSYGILDEDDRALVDQVVAAKNRSYVPYSKVGRGALLIASNSDGVERVFEGMSIDNASYAGSALAPTVAMQAARTAGFIHSVKLIATTEDNIGANPIDGESLQVLREFGTNIPITLVGPDKSVVYSNILELLPDSFGPEQL